MAAIYGCESRSNQSSPFVMSLFLLTLLHTILHLINVSIGVAAAAAAGVYVRLGTELAMKMCVMLLALVGMQYSAALAAAAVSEPSSKIFGSIVQALHVNPFTETG